MVAFILLSRHWASAGGVQEQPNIFAYLLIFTTRADFSEVYNSFSENSRFERNSKELEFIDWSNARIGYSSE
jgi:hypothetical protein